MYLGYRRRFRLLSRWQKTAAGSRIPEENEILFPHLRNGWRWHIKPVCRIRQSEQGSRESAESTLQKETATLAISKAGLSSEDIHLMFAGDLLAQTAATCFGSAGLGIPFYGLYGACSTMGESLSLGSLALTAGFGSRVLCTTSSHFASAEKEFRFPLGYGNQRPFSATWTVTGSGACILNTAPPGEKSPLRSSCGCAAITGLTAGRVMDYGLKDSMNMGGCMAPAACDTIHQNFLDFHRTPTLFDTADLSGFSALLLPGHR